jgi:hypothetical protein
MSKTASVDPVSMRTDEVLEKLRAVQRPSRHAPNETNLAAWRSELEKSAFGWETIGRRFMLKASELRDKIKAIDVLVGKARDTSSNQRSASTPALISTNSVTAFPGMPILDPDAPPDLRHTRVIAACFASQTATGWNKLVHVAHEEAMSQLGSSGALRGVTKSNLIAGRASSEDTKKGYRYVPKIDVSIQNVSAEHAWANTLRLARHLNAEVRVDFEWMRKSEAAFPGEQGHLSWKPA